MGKFLVTGAAGFIGFHLCKKLMESGQEVIAVDNINDYYDVNLKFSRLEQLGISREDAKEFGKQVKSSNRDSKLSFIRLDLQDFEKLIDIFEEFKPTRVCHLAAQAGVRYSLENPKAYIDNNINGFFNILECCRIKEIEHLVYASSSSVYGNNKDIPFKVSDNVDHPVSIYAATKKSNELMAHTYSHIYGLPTTGLRFFTVYGPWGRPDMAMYLFTNSIMNKKPIRVFNQGNLERDFTYVDDIVEGVAKVLFKSIDKHDSKTELYRVFNIGNSRSVKLMDFINAIETHVGYQTEHIMLPMQPGDVERTWANVDGLIKEYNYSPNTPIEEGVGKYVNWYQSYYKT